MLLWLFHYFAHDKQESVPLTEEEKEAQRKQEMQDKFNKAREKMDAARVRKMEKVKEKVQAQKSILPSSAEEVRLVGKDPSEPHFCFGSIGMSRRCMEYVTRPLKRME